MAACGTGASVSLNICLGDRRQGVSSEERLSLGIKLLNANIIEYTQETNRKTKQNYIVCSLQTIYRLHIRFQSDQSVLHSLEQPQRSWQQLRVLDSRLRCQLACADQTLCAENNTPHAGLDKPKGKDTGRAREVRCGGNLSIKSTL